MEMQNQIKKCTRCGLCAKVCPVFEYEKNETRLARGKFLQLLGIFEGKLKFNKNNVIFQKKRKTRRRVESTRARVIYFFSVNISSNE